MKMVLQQLKTCTHVRMRNSCHITWQLLLLYVILSGKIFLIGGAVPSSLKCEPRWIDSLVYAGKRSLDSGNVFDAKRYFAIAFNCGMSRDSMLYFAAETYLRSYVPDTALTFNWGLEKMGKFPPEVYLEQRSRIFRMMGLNHKADSIQLLIRKRERYDLSVNVSALRSIATLNPAIFPPVNNLFFDPDDIVDDAGDIQINQRLYRYNNMWFKRAFVMFNISSNFVVPTRYNFTKDGDTALKSLSCYIGVGEMPRTPELMAGHRLAIHPDLKIDHYNKVILSFSLRNKFNLSAGHEIKWTNGQVCDDRAELQLYKILAVRKVFWMPSLAINYKFLKVNNYENGNVTFNLDQATSFDIYPELPIGYIDSKSLSDSLAEKCRYYSDQNLRYGYDMDTIMFPDDDYWYNQPTIKLFEQPTKDVGFTVKSSLFLHIPFKMNLNIDNFIRCSWYPEKVKWFTVKNDSVFIDILNMKKAYAIVFNTSDGKYYLNTNRVDRTLNRSNLIELKKHEKTRFDCYLSMAINIEKEIGRLGELYFKTSYTKCFSTLPEISPLISLNQNWELRAGWKKDISKIR